jgi:hypothetical protein
VKLGRLFVHVEIGYEMQLPGAYLQKQCKFFRRCMYFQPHKTGACNYMLIWVHEWQNACRFLFRWGGPICCPSKDDSIACATEADWELKDGRLQSSYTKRLVVNSSETKCPPPCFQGMLRGITAVARQIRVFEDL